MTNLIVSMLRLSAAMTLYGVEQLEQSMNVVEGGSEIGKTIEGFEKTLDSLTDVLMKEMDDKKKETLRSASRAFEDLTHRTVEGLDMMDPRQVLKASSDLLQKTSDVTAKWVSKAAEAVEKATDGSRAPEAQPASGDYPGIP
jgi:conjugal transfer/entry exclusion protein